MSRDSGLGDSARDGDNYEMNTGNVNYSQGPRRCPTTSVADCDGGVSCFPSQASATLLPHDKPGDKSDINCLDFPSGSLFVKPRVSHHRTTASHQAQPYHHPTNRTIATMCMSATCSTCGKCSFDSLFQQSY